MRKCGTERPFTGKYNDFWEKGVYVCAACGTPLFRSEMKYEHGTGWPSFTTPVEEKNLEYRDDYSLLTKRIEVRCAICGAHLGHVFDDGPAPTFLHYCVNSASLEFQARSGGQGRRPGRRAASATETATFAAGCFWGVEYKLGKLPGVVSTVVGYTGGKTVNPDLRGGLHGQDRPCRGRPGDLRSEARSATPSSSATSSRSTTRPRSIGQGPDQGTQYRSAIFFHGEAQREAARKVMDELGELGEIQEAPGHGARPGLGVLPGGRVPPEILREARRRLLLKSGGATVVLKIRHP